MLLSADEFGTSWGHEFLVRMCTPVAGTSIPESVLHFLTCTGLPALVCYTERSMELKITFCRLASGIERFATDDLVDGSHRIDWTPYWIIGDEYFCNGSALWCLNSLTENVERLDPELPQPIEFVNSSLAHFASCLVAAIRVSAQWSTDPRDWPHQIAQLKRVLAEIDPAIPSSERCFWQICLDYVDDDGGPPCVFKKGSLLDGTRALSEGPW